MKSVVFIIPGYKHLTSQPEYQKIGDFFIQKGIDPIYVDISWERSVISENLDFSLQKFNQTKADRKYILGFSFGAVISLLASTKVKIDGQILCSLSPYFKEDLPKLKKWWVVFIGKRRYADFFRLEANILASMVNTETVLVYGSEETKFVEHRALEVYKRIKSKKSLVIVDGAKHDLSDPEYLASLQKVISKI